jgi:hypothetical protein
MWHKRAHAYASVYVHVTQSLCQVYMRMRPNFHSQVHMWTILWDFEYMRMRLSLCSQVYSLHSQVHMWVYYGVLIFRPHKRPI